MPRDTANFSNVGLQTLHTKRTNRQLFLAPAHDLGDARVEAELRKDCHSMA